MSSKLINLYWEYIKKLYNIPVADAAVYTAAAATAMQDVLTQDTMPAKAKQSSES